MLVDRIEQWGEEKGIDVEVVMINQNETVQRVSAAVEAGTMPDALDMGRDGAFVHSDRVAVHHARP
jgi:multiple sugar transport system substrate-binding protein